MPDLPRLGFGPWGSTVTLIALVWVAIGVLTLTMPLAFVIWLAIGVIGVAGLYFAGVRFHKWGIGE
jgi:hypothetical protein